MNIPAFKIGDEVYVTGWSQLWSAFSRGEKVKVIEVKQDVEKLKYYYHCQRNNGMMTQYVYEEDLSPLPPFEPQEEKTADFETEEQKTGKKWLK